MQNKQTIDELAQRISNLLLGNMQALRGDLEDNVRNLLLQAFQKMNLVTREEFDIQVALLQRSREKLERLEQQLTQLLEKGQL